MQKHPLLSVKQAAEMLQLDERSVRERLINGQLKGEKKSIGLREKWFVYSGAIQQALEKQQGNFVGDTIGVSEMFEGETIDAVVSDAKKASEEEEARDWVETNRGRVKVLAEELVKPLMEKLEAQTEVIIEQRRQIADQERQLRLLPDLQKRAEEEREFAELERKAAELRALEIEALNKQIAAMEGQKRELEEKANQANILAQDMETLKATVRELRKPWWKKWFLSGPSAEEKS